jgi:hypothetical protein
MLHTKPLVQQDEKIIPSDRLPLGDYLRTELAKISLPREVKMLETTLKTMKGPFPKSTANKNSKEYFLPEFESFSPDH